MNVSLEIDGIWLRGTAEGPGEIADFNCFAYALENFKTRNAEIYQELQQHRKALAEMPKPEPMKVGMLARCSALDTVALCAARYVKAQSARYQRELLEAIDALERTKVD